jgi:hypothetical protein
MEYKKLAGDLIGMITAAAPLVGLGEEVEAAKALIRHGKDAAARLKPLLGSDDAAALDTALDAAFARMNAHADRTADSLD